MQKFIRHKITSIDICWQVCDVKIAWKIVFKALFSNPKITQSYIERLELIFFKLLYKDLKIKSDDEKCLWVAKRQNKLKIFFRNSSRSRMVTFSCKQKRWHYLGFVTIQGVSILKIFSYIIKFLLFLTFVSNFSCPTPPSV